MKIKHQPLAEDATIKTTNRCIYPILLLVFFFSISSILMLSSSINDGAVINLSGSLRMQSYRIALNLECNNIHMDKHLVQFESSLSQIETLLDKDFILPRVIDMKYNILLSKWLDLKKNFIQERNTKEDLRFFVQALDDFVFLLEMHNYKKITILILFLGICFILVMAIYILLLRFTICKIMQSFNRYIQITHITKDKMRYILQMICSMNKKYKDSERHYKYHQKDWIKNNLSLILLYDLSIQLFSKELKEDDYQCLLEVILQAEGMTGIYLLIHHESEFIYSCKSGYVDTEKYYEVPLKMKKKNFGMLRWQGDLLKADSFFIINVAKMLARTIYISQLNQSAMKIAVLKDRNILSRELHDSIAQSLSYLRIQVNLIKKQLLLKNINEIKLLSDSLDYQLETTYIQLRELMSVFRLSMNQGDLKSELSKLKIKLQEGTGLNISLQIDSDVIEIDTQRKTHIIHIIQEACLNVVKHAYATDVFILCEKRNNQLFIQVKDNGIYL